jgi:hypothetical protein
VDLRRLRRGEWLAGIGGVALLVALFLDWYSVDGSGASAWESFSVVDIALALTGAFAIAVAVVTSLHRAGAVPIATASLLGSIGFVTALLAVWRVLDPPGSGDVSREAGLWVGLAALVAIAAGNIAAMKDETTPEAARTNVPIETLPPPEGGRA